MGFLNDLTGSLSTVWQLGVNGARIRSNAGAIESRSADNTALAPLLASQVRAPFVSDAGIRQTVLSGSVDANGFPNALSAGTGLSVTLSAATTPMLFSFAAGFDAYGSVNYTAQISTNQTISGLTASATLFLYVDRNATTGAITYGFSNLGTSYSFKAPSSPSVGTTWFDLSTFLFKQWSGSAWTVLQRIILGEVITSASSVTSVTNYAYRGIYQSLWLAVAASTTYTFNHNLGIPLAAASASVGVFTSPTGSDVDAIPATPDIATMVSDYGYQVQYPAVLTMWKTLSIATKANAVLGTSNTWSATGYYKLEITRGW